MGITYVKVKVGNPANGHRVEEVECPVDSGAVYSLIPGRILRKLGPQAALDSRVHSGER